MASRHPRNYPSHRGDIMSERIVLRTGEALVEGAEDYLRRAGGRHRRARRPGRPRPGQPDRRPGQGPHPGLRDPEQRRAGPAGDRDGEQGDGQERQVHEHPDGHGPGGDRPRRARRRPRRRHPQGQGQRPGDHLLRLARPGGDRRRTTWTTRPSSTSTARRPPRSSARRCATSRPSTGCWRTRTRCTHYFHELGIKGELL